MSCNQDVATLGKQEHRKADAYTPEASACYFE